MAPPRKWRFTTERDNTIELVAPSKTIARKMFDEAFSMLGRIKSIEDVGPVQVPLPNPWEIEKAKKPISPIRVKSGDRPQQPNAQCACGSGRKFKHCCMRRRHGR